MNGYKSKQEAELKKGLYKISSPLGPRYVHQYMLIDDQGALLIDAGMQETPEQVIIPFFQDIGLTPDKLKYVLISHADIDHYSGLETLRKICSNTTILAHQADVPWIESREKVLKERYFFYEALGVAHDPETKLWFTDNLEQSSIDVHLRGDEVIRLGHQRYLDIIHTPGHSPGHLSLYDRSNRAAIIIDAILGKGLYDTRGNIISPPPYYSIASYLQSIEKILQLDIDLLLTGHYDPMKGEEAYQFLHESKGFVRLVGETIAELLHTSSEPMSLQKILAETNIRVGNFTVMKVELVGPVFAHLMELEREGKIHRFTTNKLPYWYS